MQALDPITVSSGTPQNITFTADTLGILLYNESNFALKIDMQGYTRWVSAWTLDYVPFQSMLRTSGTFKLTPVSILNNGTPPSSKILVTLVQQGDIVTGTFPTGLTRQVNSSVTASSAFDLLAPDSANMIYLDDTSVPGSIAIIPSQSPAPTGALDLILTARQDAATVQEVLTTNVAALQMQARMKFSFELNTGTFIAGVQIITGTGSGTFNHSLGITPQAVFICPTGSVTSYDAGSYTATTFTIAGIGVGSQWKALVIG